MKNGQMILFLILSESRRKINITRDIQVMRINSMSSQATKDGAGFKCPTPAWGISPDLQVEWEIPATRDLRLLVTPDLLLSEKQAVHQSNFMI
jgi:hypothetical protein